MADKKENKTDKFKESKVKEFIKKELERRGLKRIGKCNKCGKCCEISMRFELSREENGDIILMEYKDKKTYPTCPEYDNKNKKCKIYKNRHWICTSFPGLPEFLEPVKKTCGYKFIKI